MAKKVVRWKPGKTGLYSSHTMLKSDWKSLGFEGDDTEQVEFTRERNFTVVADKLSALQLDFFENDSDFEVKELEEPKAASEGDGEKADGEKASARRTPGPKA